MKNVFIFGFAVLVAQLSVSVAKADYAISCGSLVKSQPILMNVLIRSDKTAEVYRLGETSKAVASVLMSTTARAEQTSGLAIKSQPNQENLSWDFEWKNGTSQRDGVFRILNGSKVLLQVKMACNDIPTASAPLQYSPVDGGSLFDQYK